MSTTDLPPTLLEAAGIPVPPETQGRSLLADDAAATHYVEHELYDLDSDPADLTNLAGLPSHQPIAEELRARR